jgi:tetratricopeptide (TPR) repeat protein
LEEGRSLLALGRFEEAARALAATVAADPSVVDAHLQFGHALLALGRPLEAQAAFSAARQLAPKRAEAHDGLGIALHHAGFTAAATESLRAALDCDPTSDSAALNLGKVLLEVGELEEAVSWIEHALELNPRNGSAYLALVTFRLDRIDAQRVKAMAELADDPTSLPLLERIDLHFALGMAYEREGRLDAAFEHFRIGNALKRAIVPYDEAATLNLMTVTEQAFSSELFEHLRGCGEPSTRPLFIFGMPRSGTTLVEQLLAAHPQVVAGGELGIFGPVTKDVWSSMRAASLDELRGEFRQLGAAYLRASDALAGDAVRLLDTTLDNVQLAPLIAITLPNARMIHVVRDPLDTCFSCFATPFGGSQVPFSYDLGELGRYHATYARMMERWHEFVRPDRLLRVQYEQLVDDFETEARRIVTFCGLAWNDACRTASNFHLRQPLYRTAIGRGQRFRRYLGPLIEALTSAR